MSRCEFCSGENPIFNSGSKIPLKRNRFRVKSCNTGEIASEQMENLLNMCLGTTMEVELKISYCPMCGRKLTEGKTE